MMSFSVRQQVSLGIIFVLFAVVISATDVHAQGANQWAIKMFSEVGTNRSHDFGSVALHAEVEHRFLFKNIYKEDVEIASANSNCSCTKVSVTKNYLRPMETAEIVARVDTSGKEHTKKRKATITVQFTKPQYGEVQLQVKSYIRPDVGFEPGVIDFGTIPLGKSVTKKAFLQYEGRSDWALTAVKKTSSSIRAEAREVQRQNGRVTYEIQVTLKENAVPGYLNDLLRFTTNERETTTASVFLPIHGLVLEPLTVKPSFVQLGVIHPGEKVSKNLVVRSSTPFLIKSIVSDDPRISFLVANQESSIHVVPITFAAENEAGAFHPEIKIVTNQKDMNQLSVQVTGIVLAKEESVSSSRPVEQNVMFEENGLIGQDESAEQRGSEEKKALEPLALDSNTKSWPGAAEDVSAENMAKMSPLPMAAPSRLFAIPQGKNQASQVQNSKESVKQPERLEVQKPQVSWISPTQENGERMEAVSREDSGETAAFLPLPSEQDFEEDRIAFENPAQDVLQAPQQKEASVEDSQENWIPVATLSKEVR